MPILGTAPASSATQPQDYGAKGDGVADDTTAVQAAINAAQAKHGTVYLPNGLYRITASLQVTDAVTIRGESLTALHGSVVTNDWNSINAPVVPPYLAGAVLLMDTPATDALVISGAGRCVNLSNLGIRFADSFRFRNTGHGISYVPPTINGKTYRDNGLASALWDNVTVFGHDGNHYAYYLTNSIYCSLRHLRAFGGGVLLMENNGSDQSDGFPSQQYGNVHVDHLYGQLFCKGTAQGVYLKNTGSVLNLVHFTRPQVTVGTFTATFPETTAPLATGQQMFTGDDGVRYYSIVAADFESNVGATSHMPLGAQSRFVPHGGITGQDVWQIDNTFRSDGIRAADPNSVDTVFELVNGVGRPFAISNDDARVLKVPGPVQPGGFTTATRPSASACGAGAQVFDTTLNRPIWSTGTAWVDASGATA